MEPRNWWLWKTDVLIVFYDKKSPIDRELPDPNRAIYSVIIPRLLTVIITLRMSPYMTNIHLNMFKWNLCKFKKLFLRNKTVIVSKLFPLPKTVNTFSSGPKATKKIILIKTISKVNNRTQLMLLEIITFSISYKENKINYINNRCGWSRSKYNRFANFWVKKQKQQQQTWKPSARIVIANTFSDGRQNSRQHSYDSWNRNGWNTPLERVGNIKPRTVIYQREFRICSRWRTFW